MGKNFPLISNLKERPGCFEATVKLIEKAFHYQAPNSFLVDFAPLIDPSNHHNCFILIDENENVIAHIGVKEAKLKVNDAIVPVAMLGGIVVNESHRGEGHFQTLFQNVLAEKRSDVAFFLLWSDQQKLYGKYGLHLCGGQYELVQTKGELNFEQVDFASLNQALKQDIKFLYETSFCSQYVTVLRSPSDWGMIARIRSSECYIKRKEGKIVSYFFKGKGQDLTDIIHEYGTSEDFISFLKEARCYGKIWMGHPWIETDVLQYQFMLCPADMRSFREFIAAQTLGQVMVRDINVMKQEIYFDFNQETLALDIDEFLKGILGPGAFEELGETRPLFLSGLDSI